MYRGVLSAKHRYLSYFPQDHQLLAFQLPQMCCTTELHGQHVMLLDGWASATLSTAAVAAHHLSSLHRKHEN